MRQVVGDRQRFCPLQGQGVVERDRHGFEQGPHGAQHARRQPRLVRRGCAIEANQRAHAVTASDQRKCEHGSHRLAANACIAAQIVAGEFLAVLHHPVRDRAHGGLVLADDAATRKHRQLAGQIGREERPVARRHPLSRVIDDDVGDLGWLEGRVHSPDKIDERITPLDTGAQNSLKGAQPACQIETGRSQRQISRAS